MNKRLLFCILLTCLNLSRASEVPSWITSPYESACEESRHLCAVGEGNGALSAEISARAGLVRMFKSDVSSELQVTSESQSAQGIDEALSADFKERVRERLDEKSDFVIEGGEVAKTFEGRDEVFVLVKLNKKKAALNFKDQIDEVDAQNKELFLQKKRSDLLKMEMNFALRQELHRYYRFLSGRELSSPVKYKELLKLRTKLREKNIKVYISFKNKFPQELKHHLLSEVLAQDYRIVENQNREYDYKIKADLKSSKAYLNVKGFEKYDFQLLFTSYNAQKEKLGALNIEGTEIGRTKEQALEKIMENSKEKIREDFYKLKLN